MEIGGAAPTIAPSTGARHMGHGWADGRIGGHARGCRMDAQGRGGLGSVPAHRRLSASTVPVSQRVLAWLAGGRSMCLVRYVSAYGVAILVAVRQPGRTKKERQPWSGQWTRRCGTSSADTAPPPPWRCGGKEKAAWTCPRQPFCQPTPPIVTSTHRNTPTPRRVACADGRPHFPLQNSPLLRAEPQRARLGKSRCPDGAGASPGYRNCHQMGR